MHVLEHITYCLGGIFGGIFSDPTVSFALFAVYINYRD